MKKSFPKQTLNQDKSDVIYNIILLKVFEVEYITETMVNLDLHKFERQWTAFNHCYILKAQLGPLTWSFCKLKPQVGAFVQRNAEKVFCILIIWSQKKLNN